MSEQTENRDVYIQYIESCFSSYPEARAYYEPLKEHLEAGTGRQQSSFQQINLFETSSSLSEATRYPQLFPFESVSWQTPQRGPRVAVLEGFPSPECVGLLGARLRIRPEFFIGNLKLTGKRIPAGHMYELPTVPSLQANLVRVRFVSAFRDLKNPKKQTSRQIARQRSDLQNAFSKYDQGLSNDGEYGRTRFRTLNQHDSRTYSMEQALSMTVSQQDGQWTATFLADQGRSPTTTQGLPWSNNRSNRPIGTIELVPYNLPVGETDRADHMSTSGTTSRGNQSLAAKLDQFHPLRRVAVNDEIDVELLNTDPFFLLASVLTTSLLSWSQLLNMVSEIISQSQSQLELAHEELEFQLSQLRYHMKIIHRANEELSENLKVVEQGACRDWPKATSIAAQQRKSAIQEQLRIDYTHVMERCSLLLNQCSTTTTVLVGFAQLTTAKRGSEQAMEVHGLTKLATIFVPLSFSASVFSMNITQLQPDVSIGWFFGVVSILLIVTFSIMFRKQLRGFVLTKILRRHDQKDS